MQCFKCKMDIPERASICPHCGTTTNKIEFLLKTLQAITWSLISIIFLLVVLRGCFILGG
jgi:predicted amidophosphoribosyltransferase